MLLDLRPLLTDVGTPAPPPVPEPPVAGGGGRHRRTHGDVEAPTDRDLFPPDRPRRARRHPQPTAPQPRRAAADVVARIADTAATVTVLPADPAPLNVPDLPDFTNVRRAQRGRAAARAHAAAEARAAADAARVQRRDTAALLLILDD